MKRVWKSVLSVALALVLIVTVCVPAFAGVKKPTPVIHVHGFNACDLYNYDETKVPLPLKEDQVEFYAAAAVVAAKLVEQMSVPNAPFDKEAFIEDLGRVAELLTFNCDKDGNPDNGSYYITYDGPLSEHMEERFGEDYDDPDANNSGALAYEKQLGEEIGYDRVYTFFYDYRLDSVESAEKLDDYIQMVKKQTGSQKVSIIADSEGGQTLAAYFDAYMKKDDVERAIFVNPAFAGVSVADMYSGNYTVSEEGANNYFLAMAKTLNSGNLEAIITAAVYLLQYQIHTLSGNMNDIAEDEELMEKMYLEFFKPAIGNIPIFYEFLPYEDFDDAMDYLIKIGFMDTKSDLYTKICRYHKVQGRLAKNLKKLQKRGVQVAIIANYGSPNIPLTDAFNNQTDSLIDTEYSSAYATVADYGEVLPVSNSIYYSPDRVIDATTCALPNNTFFIRGVMHTMFNYRTDALNLIIDMTLGKVKPTLQAVYKKYGYTQFVKVDNADDQNLSNITEDDIPVQE